MKTFVFLQSFSRLGKARHASGFALGLSKTFDFIRNRSLLLAAIAAMLLGGSCSESFVAGPDDTDAVIETRATPTITVTCDPAPKGENQNYLGLEEIYRFRGSSSTMTSPGHFELSGCDFSIHAADGSTDGYEIIDSVELLQPIGYKSLFVKFTKPGWYHLTAEAEYNGAVYQQTVTYCVASLASNVTMPETIRLGEPFDFSFTFSDSRYPAPTIEIGETLFDDPKVTVLENDDQGNFRLRIDQPGKYIISTGLGGIFTVCAHIDIYWRPEIIGVSSRYSVNINTNETSYFNSINICDSNGIKYMSLPYRVYMEYETDELLLSGVPEPPVNGTIMRGEGADGSISMPKTGKEVRGAVLEWKSPKHPFNLHWDLTIPEDRQFLVRMVDDIGDAELVDPAFPVYPDFPKKPTLSGEVQ